MIRRDAPRVCLWMLFALLVLCGLSNAAAAAQANPFDETVQPIEIGDRLPSTGFIDQRGARMSFAQPAGRTAVISFIFTRCTDECPLITRRFVRLDRLLGPGPFVLALVTIDPNRDTVPAIASYARKYHVAGRIHILTGSPDQVNAFVRSAGVSVIDNGTGDLIHNTKLFIVDPHGRLASVVDDSGWNATDVAAEAEHVAGDSSSLLARVDFQLTNAIAALCGGSFQTASGILDALAAGVVILLGVIALAVLRRRIFAQGS